MSQYSNYALGVIVFVLFLGYAVADLDSGDIEAVCNTANTTLKFNGTSWECDFNHYGHFYFHNDSLATISIANPSVHYNITASTFETGDCRGLTCGIDHINITKNGLYYLSLQLSFQGGNGGDYDIEFTKNNTPLSECSFHRTTSAGSIGSGSIVCLQDFNAGDTVHITVEDLNNPASDIDVHVISVVVQEVD